MTGTERERLVGVPGRLACLAAVVLGAVGGRGWGAAAALALALALACACHRTALRVLASVYAWVMVGLLVLPAALLGDPPRHAVGPVGVSAAGLALGAEMSARALAILLAAAGFAATVPVVAVAALLDRAGLGGLGFSMGVAVNMLPVLQATTVTTWQAFRQRGGFRRRRLRSLRLVAATIVSETLRRAEDVVAAAHARGFGAAPRPLALARGRCDFAIAAALAAAVIVIWLV